MTDKLTPLPPHQVAQVLREVHENATTADGHRLWNITRRIEKLDEEAARRAAEAVMR